MDYEQEWFDEKNRQNQIAARNNAQLIAYWLEGHRDQELRQFKDPIAWLLFKVEQDASIALEQTGKSKEEILQLLQNIIEKNSLPLGKDFNNLLTLLDKYKSKSRELREFKDEIAWLLFKVDQDPSIALEQTGKSKEEILQLLQNILENNSLPFKKDYKNLLRLLNKYKSKSREELHYGIVFLILKVAQDPSIAVNQLNKSKEQVIEWLIQNREIIKQEDIKQWPKGYDLYYLVKLIKLYKGESNEDELSFLSRITNLIASLWPPSQRIGSRTRPETLPYFTDKHVEAKYGLEPQRLTSTELESIINPIKFVSPYPRPNGNDTPSEWQSGGKSKRIFKRKVKSKKRRR